MSLLSLFPRSLLTPQSRLFPTGYTSAAELVAHEAIQVGGGWVVDLH